MIKYVRILLMKFWFTHSCGWMHAMSQLTEIDGMVWYGNSFSQAMYYYVSKAANINKYLSVSMRMQNEFI